MVDKCICCGAVIPEGRHVCPECKVVVKDGDMNAYDFLVKYVKEVKPHEKEVRKKLERRKKPTVKVVLDEEAKMPCRAFSGDAGYDLFSREDAVIYPSSGGLFDTGVHVAIPEGYVGFLKSKSGLNVNYNIVSCGGTIDEGYTGSIRVKLYNLGKKPYMIRKGQKICQLVIMPCLKPELEVVDELEETERGNNGFGSSGL